MNIFLLVFLLSNSKIYDFPESYKPSEEFALIYKLEEKYIKEVEKNRKFICTRVGGGGTQKNKHNRRFSFAYYEEKSIDEARGMLLDLIEKAVTTFNSSPEYTEYLKEGPYSYKNFGICIFFRKTDGGFGETDKFSGCSIHQGEIQYTNRLLGDQRVLLKETYEEAKAKLAEQKK